MAGLDTNKIIYAYWWRPNKRPYNFGDELGAIILRKLGYDVRRVALAKADVVLTGTILDMAETVNPGVTVIGAGAGYTHEAVHDFTTLAVRGKLTNDTLKTNAVMGDLGLLASRLWPKRPAKYNIGVVRHFVDKDKYPYADIVINANEDPETVIRKISQCRVILSSSLHGLIVADSYGIPNMRIARDDVITGNWKWLDYKTAFVLPLAEIQDQLIEAIGKL
jgi:pyruvyltransferase